MRFADVLGAVHQWMDAVKIQYDSWLEVEILEDRDMIFRAVIESRNHLVWFQEWCGNRFIRRKAKYRYKY